MSKRYVIAALLAPAAVFVGLVTIGGKHADTAGLAVFNDRGNVLAFKHGAALEFAAAGVLLAWLTR